jgi:hypothetical protein
MADKDKALERHILKFIGHWLSAIREAQRVPTESQKNIRRKR